MSNPRIPDLETRKRLLRNLRQTRLEMRQFNLELEEINALLEQQIRQQKLKHVKESLRFNQSQGS